MSTISANITGYSNISYNSSIGVVHSILFTIDKASTDFVNGDSLRIETERYNVNGAFSAFLARVKSVENISPLQINGSVTFNGDNSAKITRTNPQLITNQIGTTAGVSYDDRLDIVTYIIFITTDGQYLAYLNNFIWGASGEGSIWIVTYDEIYPKCNINGSVYTRITVPYSYLKSCGDAIAGALVPDDPYAGAGDSTTGGGDGTFDGSSDPVPVPNLPSIGATDTGFISLFVPSASQIRQVATYLWGPLLDISTFKKLFEDPMDCILGLSVVPVAVPTSGNAQITVGNVELSGITLPLASQQYVELDCGTITFDRYFGSYLDFEPYTKMSLFVPYSGVHSVSADDIMGKTVGLKYHIDILTGSLVAFLTCGDSVLYEFNGACASNIPVNSMNYASTIENAIRIAVNIGTTVATAGAAAPLTGENAAARTAAKEFGTKVSIAGSTAEGALSLKPSIDRAGSLGGTTGLMGNQIPYFIITRPRMCKPKNQDFFQGYPSFIQTVVGDMEGAGFTAFENVIIAETYLTETEKTELSGILSAGVYL